MNNRFTLSFAAALLSAASFAQAPASYAKAVKKAPAMITEQPAGKLYKDMYGYAEGFESMWGEIYESKKDGFARDFVVGDDGAYYMKNPISFMPTNSWIKGEKAEGDTIIFKLPQYIFDNEVSDEDGDRTVKYYASRLKFQKIDGENNYVIDEDSQDMKFVWRNDSLIKVDDGDVLGMTSENGSWNGLGDLTSETAVNPFTNEAPQDPSKAVRRIFTFHPSERNTTQRVSDVVVEGDDYYMNNVDANIPEAWIHGKIKDGKVTFSGPQYLGLDKNASQFRFNFPANVYYDEDTYMTEYQTLNSVTFDYDAETQALSNCEYGFMSNYGYRLIALQMQVMMQPTVDYWNEVVARPQNPRIINYTPADAGSGCLIVDIPRNNVEDCFMDQSRVFFNVYFDDELMTFYPDQYKGITEAMTDVPVDFTDSKYDFQSFGSQHRIVIYDSGFDRAGIRVIYKNGDNTLSSDIVWSDGTVTGLKSAAIGSAVKSVDFYDLNGTAVNNPQHGVFVKKTVMSDGTVKTSKVVVK